MKIHLPNNIALKYINLKMLGIKQEIYRKMCLVQKTVHTCIIHDREDRLKINKCIIKQKITFKFKTNLNTIINKIIYILKQTGFLSFNGKFIKFYLILSHNNKHDKFLKTDVL